MIKKLQEHHLESLLEIRNHESTRQYLENNNKFTTKECIDWFRTTKPYWFIIEIEDKMVGYIRTSNKEKNSIWIGMDIHPDYRKKGIAYNTYIEFINKLYKEEKISIFYLEVFTKNEAAMQLYLKLGFKKVSSRIVNDLEYQLMELKYNDFKNKS